MKILQVGSSMPNDWGGIERYVTHLGQGLVARGHDVTLAAPKDSPLAERSKLHVRYARVRHKYDFGAVSRFVRWYKTLDFDIVNVHFSPDYFVPAWAAKIARQRGMILTRHLVLPMSRGRVRAYNRLYDHLIAVSGAAGDALLQSGFSTEKMTVARAGIPAVRPKKSQSREALGIGEDDFGIGIFGRLTPEKGHENLFNALPLVQGKVSCHVFGSGPLSSRLKDMSTELPVKFHGYMSEIGDAMNTMDAIAVPSVWAEAFSIAILEAMSLGKAIVAAPVGGIPEAIQDGQTGLLADCTDPRVFANAIQRLIDDRELREKCGAGAKALHQAEYTLEKFAERIEGVYKRVLDRD